MDNLFAHDVVLVRQRIRFPKAANAYDLFDQQGQKIGEVLEDVPGRFKKMLKFTNWRKLISYTVHFYDSSRNVLLTIKRPFTFSLIRSSISVYNHDGRPLGMYRQKPKFIKPEFTLFDPNGAVLASLKCDWKGWNFSLVDQTGVELAKITKKWAGIAKELFTSADNYVISVSRPDIPEDLRKMIFAAGIGIDMSLKE